MKFASAMFVLLLLATNYSYADCGPNRHPVTTWPIETCADDGQILPSTVPPPSCSGDICKLITDISREIGKTPEAVRDCLTNVQLCATEILSAPLALPAQTYIDGLYKQSEGKSYLFSPEFISLVSPYYPGVNFSGVTYANDIIHSDINSAA